MYGLLTAIGLGLATLAAAFPVIEIQNPELYCNDTSSDSVLYDAEIHANVMAFWPSDRITTSGELRKFLQTTNSSSTSEVTNVYLSDTHAWVDISTLQGKGSDQDNKNSSDVLQRRDCAISTAVSVPVVQQYWGPWHAVSNCVFCDANPGGCSESMAYSDGMTYTVNGGITIDVGVIKAMVGYQVSWVYSHTSTTTCTAKYKDRVQVWRRNKHVWARTKKVSCIDCDGQQGPSCDPPTYGWIHSVAAASELGLHQNGCSAKSNGPLKDC